MRAKVLRDAFPEASGTQGPPALFARGGLCHKCRQIFESLYTAYRGDLGRVMAHVQVERWNVSRKYRVGASTIGPRPWRSLPISSYCISRPSAKASQSGCTVTSKAPSVCAARSCAWRSPGPTSD